MILDFVKAVFYGGKRQGQPEVCKAPVKSFSSPAGYTVPGFWQSLIDCLAARTQGGEQYEPRPLRNKVTVTSDLTSEPYDLEQDKGIKGKACRQDALFVRLAARPPKPVPAGLG
jgi:hypothetical protein